MKYLPDAPALVDPSAQPAEAVDYLSNTSGTDLLRSPSFLNDLREYYESKGARFLTEEELIDRFYSDNTWDDLNTVSAIGSAIEAGTANTEQKQRLNRLQQAWRSLPNFWQEGGRGFMAAAADATGAILADPINLIPGVNAYAKGAAAARGAAAAGRSATGAGIRAGARSGALSEAAISGGQEAIVNAASQVRDVQLGLRDNFSTGELAGATALGAGLGGTVGGAIGAGAGALASRTGAQQAETLGRLGYSPEEIGGLTNQQVQQRIPREMPDFQMPDGRQSDEAAEETPELTPEQQRDAKWQEQTARATAVRDALRDRVDELRADGADPEVIEAMQQRLDAATRLIPMTQRLAKEEADIINFGGTNDSQQRARHSRRTKEYERDFSEWRELVSTVEDASDVDAVNARIDEIQARVEADRAQEVEAAAETPPEAAADEAVATGGEDAPPPDGPDAAASPIETSPTTEPLDGAEPEAEGFPEFKYRSDAQRDSVRNLLEQAGMNEYDLSVMVANGEIKVGKRGNLLTQQSVKDLRAKLKPVIEELSAKKTDDELPSAVGPDPVAVETPAPRQEVSTDPLRGQALFAGIDPNSITPPKRSKTGKVTKSQVNKAIAARAPDAEPDAYAAQVRQDLDDALDLIGAEEDLDALRQAVAMLARSSKSEDADILALFDHLTDVMPDDGPEISLGSIDFTKTELKKIERRAKELRRQQPGMGADLATEIATGEIKAQRGADTQSVRGTGESIEDAKKFTTAGRNVAGRIQGFLRRGTPIGKGSDYTTTRDMRVKRSEFGFEAAIIEARSGKGPDIVAYTTLGPETIMTRTGKVQVPKGTVAYADGYTRRAYDSMELAIEARGDGRKDRSMPKVTDTGPAQNNIKKLLDEFGDDPEAFRRALQAVRDGATTPKSPAIEKLPLVRGPKLAIAQHKTRKGKDGGPLIRMVDPKQADAGKNISSVLGKDLDGWEVKYADRSRFTNNQRKLRDLWNATSDDARAEMEGIPPDAALNEAGYETSLGRPMTQVEASFIELTADTTLTEKETAAILYAGKKTDHIKKIDEVTVADLLYYEMALNSTRWQRNLNEHRAIGEAIKSLNEVMDRIAPNGIKLPNAKRADAMRKLDEIFAGVGTDELQHAREFLTRMGGDRAVAPELGTSTPTPTMTGVYEFGVPREDGMTAVTDLGVSQRVGVKQTPTKVYPNPRLMTFYHEMAHWAYYNILTHKDRADFWKSMDKYYTDDGKLDIDLLVASVPKVDEKGVPLNNALEAPAELFANQFEVFMANKIRGYATGSESYWRRVTKYIQAVFDRYFGGVMIDPDLEPMFAKILPDEESGAFAMGKDAVAKTDAGKTYNRRYAQIKMDRQDLKDAIFDDSPEGIVNASRTIVETLLTLAPRVHIAMKRGTTGTLMPLIPMRSMIRQRIDDISEILSGKPFDFDAYDKGEMPRWMIDEGLTAVDDPTEAADMLRDFYFNGYNGKFQPSNGIPAGPKGQPINKQYTSLEKLFDMMETRLEAAYKKAESGDLPPSATPKLDTDVEPSERPNPIKRKAAKKKQRIEKAADAAAAAVTKTPAAKRTRRNPKSGRVVDPAFAESLKTKEPNELRSLFIEHKGTERGDQVAFELMHRVKSQPASAYKEARITKEIKAMKSDELEATFLNGLETGDQNTVNMAITEMMRRQINKRRRKEGLQIIQPRILKRDILQKEIDDNVGLAQSDGIPPAARASVREILGYITHRDPEIQYTARTMAYRMLNLMGKTSRKALGEANVMTSADLARLANTDPNTVGNAAFADFRAPEFQKLRSDLRRMAIGLNKGKANPFDMMHEIGHVMVRSGVLADDEIAAIREAYTLANDTTKKRIQTAYAGKYADRTENIDDLLAEEWFSEGLAYYMAERVAKGDILEAALDGNIGNLRMRNSFSRAMDKMIEYIAYVLNGMVGRNDIKQQYRRLFLFGDMFQTNTTPPLATVIRRTKGLNASYAADAVADHIANSPSARLAKIRNFVGDGMSYDANSGTFLEFYHGTPNGWAFKRNTNPDVILGGSARGQKGPGVYLTRSAAVASEVYSRKPTYENLLGQINRLVEEEKIDEETSVYMVDAARDLINTRLALSKARRKYSEFTQFNQEKEKRDLIKERIDYFVDEEQELNDYLIERGLLVEPMVIPTFVRVMNPADFRTRTIYQPNQAGIPSPMAKIFIDHGDMMQIFRPTALDSFARDTSSRRLDGEEMYQRIVQLYTESGFSKEEGQRMLNEVLDDNGYDGIRSTHRNSLGIQGTEQMPNGEFYEASMTEYEALTVFETSNVKHVDADEFDDFDDRLFYRASEAMPRGTAGSVTEAIMNRAINRTSDVNPASLGEVMEGDGVSSPMTSAIMSMIRGRKLDVKEEQAMRKTSPFWWLQSQSQRMKDLGAHWVGDWYKNNFPSLHQKFASKYFPIHHQLRALPDADGKVRAWARAASGSVGQAQPKSYQRIVKALRRGYDKDGNETRYVKNLSDQERTVWNQIRNALSAERDEMIAKGMYVGDRGPNYLPQVWNKEKIRDNKQEFLASMADYFRMEKTAHGILDYTDEQAADFADGLFATLAEDGADGVFVPIQGGSRNPKFENVDFSRIIELEKYPAAMDSLEKFLEDDLEALLVKYFEGSSRRINHAEQMGINSHAFYDYILAADAGREGIIRLLTTAKDFRKDIRAISESGYPEYATLSDVVRMPFEGKEGQAAEFVDNLIRVSNDDGAGAARKMLETIAPMDPDGTIPLAYKRRADAIIGALTDYKGQKVNWKPSDFEFMENSMRVAMKKPQTGTGSRGMMNFSRAMRSFNSVTLLGFTTLTSLGDLVLPIIRSGSFTDWAKGVHKWKSDPEYAQFIHDTGVAMENIVHERMVHMYGAVDGKLTNAFFNATMLTPWTDMNRQIAGATGYEAMKTMQRKARKHYKEGLPIGEQPVQYKTAARFLNTYGLGDYLPSGVNKGISLGDRKLMGSDPALGQALIKFADEAIFQPNPNDIPLWAQTPWGSMIFQLKSFPLMMTRLGKHVVDEAMKGNVKPLAYFATLGPAFGMGALAAKDIVQMRGGDDERSPELRRRNILKALGYDEKVHGNEQDFLGWYVEGMMMMGGLGLIGDVMHSAVTQVDNGAYGKIRIASTIAGPSFGAFMSAVDVGAGAKDAMVGGDNSNAKERSAVREMATRIPVVGGIRAAREGIVDTLAGEPDSGRRKKNPWQTSWSSGWK